MMRYKICRKTDERRFWTKVRKTKSCWIWTGSKTTAGYGVFDLESYGKNRIYAHRWSYKQYIGELKTGHFVCHKCDNPPCINPSHLFLGTPRDNVTDCINKGRDRTRFNLGQHQRSKTECKKGHAFNNENTGWYGPQLRYRRCKECSRIKARRQRELQKSKVIEATF
jgi:HNH endonuclease